MSKRLKSEDLTILKTGATFIAGVNNKYYSPRFGLNEDRDEIVLNIYDTTGELLTTTNVNIDTENGLTINPGNDLRDIGFLTGIYKLRYNFFRRQAGANSVVLVRPDHNNIVYNGDPKITGIPTNEFWVNDDGRIYVGQPGESEHPEELSLKDYQFYVHQISSDRMELRLSSFHINDFRYLDQFNELSDDFITYSPIQINESGKLKFSIDADIAEWNFDIRDENDVGFKDHMINSMLKIENAFIIGYQGVGDDTNMLNFGQDIHLMPPTFEDVDANEYNESENSNAQTWYAWSGPELFGIGSYDNIIPLSSLKTIFAAEPDILYLILRDSTIAAYSISSACCKFCQNGNNFNSFWVYGILFFFNPYKFTFKTLCDYFLSLNIFFS